MDQSYKKIYDAFSIMQPHPVYFINNTIFLVELT
jgi:hypothetical protein